VPLCLLWNSTWTWSEEAEVAGGTLFFRPARPQKVTVIRRVLLPLHDSGSENRATHGNVFGCVREADLNAPGRVVEVDMVDLQ